MIEIANDEIVTLAEAAKLLPQRRRGKKPHVSTLHRWAGCGLRGIRLETIRIGGTICTSLRALQEFFDQLTANERPGHRSTARPGRASRAAAERLDEIGI